MMIKIYGIKNCTACRQAKAFLPDCTDFIDVRNNPLTELQIISFFKIFGSKLINTKSKTWRDLDERNKSLTETQLLLDFPTVMKRPLIKIEEEYFLGWADEVKELISSKININ